MWRKPNESAPSQPVAPAVKPEASIPAGSVPASTPAPAASSYSETPAAPSRSSAPVAAPSYTTSAHSSSADASRVAAGIKITGKVTGTADLIIEGTIKGEIRLGNSRLTIGPQGNVEADVEAREVVVEGQMTGNIRATEKVVFGPASQMKGSISAPRLGIQEGARISGRVDMGGAQGSQSNGAASTNAAPAKARESKPQPALASTTTEKQIAS